MVEARVGPSSLLRMWDSMMSGWMVVIDVSPPNAAAVVVVEHMIVD